MKKYFYKLLMILLIAPVSSFAQNIGVDYFKTGELEIAQDIFAKQLSQNPGEANYYLGEIAFVKGDLNKAKSYYQAGLTASPDYVLNNVGLGKVLLKSDPKTADNEFSTALKKDKKDVAVLVAIAEAYYKAGMTKEKDEYLEKAKKANKKSPLIYELEGDIFKAEKNVGGASGQYEQSLLFDPNYTVADIKIAQLYTDINASTSIDKLTKVLEARPDYVIANKYLGNIYYKNGNYKRAIEAFKAFFSHGEYSLDDLTRYAASLYFDGRYDEANKYINEAIKKDPNSFVLNRLLMYNAIQTEDYDTGLTVGEKFFSMPKGDNDYIARDYLTFAKILSTKGLLDRAIEQYDAAIKLDPNQYVIYKEIAESLANAGASAKAGDYYQKYIDGAGESAEALDFFNMGRYYYTAAGSALNDTVDVDAPVKMKEYLAKADAAFGVVGERIPDSHLGFLFRARANSLLDQSAELGLAKPYYEKVLEVIKAKGDTSANTRELLEAYKYLSYYYYVQFDKHKKAEDKANTIEYSKLMLELDPGNSIATQLIDALK